MGAPLVESSESRADVGAPTLPVLATKLALPHPSPSLVPRPRLIARLNPGTPVRLALLVASAGSGKSTLVSQWCLQQAEGSVGYLSLDPEDSDPARFLLYLCAALETVVPEAAAPVRAFLQSPETPSLQYALTRLLNGLAALPRRVTLVLDDYHRIEAGPVHDLVTFLLEHQPSTLFLILTSRSDPPLPLARLRVGGQLIGIHDGDLRFTDTEATQFLSEVMGLALPPEAMARLAERTEGWIAGLQLAALSLQDQPDSSGFMEAFSGSNRYLVDYLTEEVLRRQPSDVQAFLGKTAFLKRLCAPLCEAVTGAPGGQSMLERLEAANLFLIPLDRERHWYRYHHLFADVLQTRLLPEQGEPLEMLYGRASAWYEAEGMVGEAIEHALAGRLFERAAGLIEIPYRNVWQQDTWRTLERWLRALPPTLIQTWPHLSLALAAFHNYSFRTAEAEQVLNACPVEPQEAGAPEGAGPAPRALQGQLLMVRGWTARLQGDGARVARLMRQALDLLPADNHDYRTGALLNLGMVHEACGELVAAEEALAATVREAQTAGLAVLRVRASYGYGQLRETQGALQEAARLYRDALEYAEEQCLMNVPVAALLYAALGRIRYQRNDLSAGASLAEGLERVDSAFADANRLYAVPCCFELWRLQTALGDTAAADAMFERLADTAQSINVPCLEPLLAVLRARRKQTPAAVTAAWLAAFEARTAGEALPSVPIPDLCLPDIRGLEIVTWAQLRLAQGDPTGVETRLKGFVAELVRQGRHGSALEVRVLLATLQWEGGHREQAVAALEPALALAVREGYRRVFREAAPGLAPVLRQAAALGIAPEMVGTLLAAPSAADRSADAPTESSSTGLIERLSDRELEVLRLVAAGLRNAEIAAQLFLSEGTVHRHIHNLYGKLGVTRRMNAVARARALGLL